MIVAEIVTAVIGYLKSRRQLEWLPQVAQALSQASLTQIDPNLALVSSAVPLSAKQKQALVATLSRVFNRPVRLKARLEPGLIGGLKVSLAGRVIDISLNQQLFQLKESLVYD